MHTIPERKLTNRFWDSCGSLGSKLCCCPCECNKNFHQLLGQGEIIHSIVPGKSFWPAASHSDEMQPQLVDFINSGQKQRAAIKIKK